MIFATIGTQAPFDRFVRMVDELSIELSIKEEIIVQTIGLHYKPQNVKVVGFLPPDVFNEYFNKARLILAHAGMGTILSALQQNKPIIIVPRLAFLHEHRNDHQMATAMQFDELGFVHVAYDKEQLRELMVQYDLAPLKHIGNTAAPSLLNSIINFIDA